jgi:hypothetical protein
MSVAHDTYGDDQGNLVYAPRVEGITRDLSERATRLADSGCLSASDAEAIQLALAYSREHHHAPDDLPSFF